MQKKITMSMLMILTSAVLMAQPRTLQNTVLRVGGFSFFTDGGITLPSGSLRNNAYTGRGYGTTAGLYLPFYQKYCECLWRSRETRSYSLGFVAGGGYILSENGTPELEQTRRGYQLDTGTLNIVATPRPTTSAWQIFAGIEGRFGFSRFSIAPSVSIGYQSITNTGFATCAIRQAGLGNLLLRSLPGTTTNGMVVNGRLELGYRVCKRISLYGASTISYGPALNYSITALQPSGGFRSSNTYTMPQLESGIETDIGSSSRFTTVSVLAGLRFNLAGTRIRSRH
jgi:hypothetical protein